MDSKLEQCVCVKFCFKSGYTATDMFKLLQKVYGCECLSCTTIFEWSISFATVMCLLMMIQEGGDPALPKQLKTTKLCTQHWYKIIVVRSECTLNVLTLIKKPCVQFSLQISVKKKRCAYVLFHMCWWQKSKRSVWLLLRILTGIIHYNQPTQQAKAK